MLAVCACGRIFNPKTAQSRVIGAMTMGIGAALMEHLAVDKRPDYGFFVNHDLAGYEVPGHADILHLEVIFLDETHPMSSPMKAKGAAELGLCWGARGTRVNSISPGIIAPPWPSTS
jgi:xanthine dehydrogenase YagR molybdenum-binding subunit